jgi:hypothetical protein
VIVTYSASSRSLGLSWAITALFSVRKTIPARSMHFVLPADLGFVYSQARMAKKNAPMTKSATTAGAVSMMAECWDASSSFRSSLGVVAF